MGQSTRSDGLVKTSQRNFTRSQDRYRGRDRNRRRRVFTALNKCEGLTRGQRATMTGLLERSDDTASMIWGEQEKLATELRISSRQLRRDVCALEAHGLLKVIRGNRMQLPDGTWTTDSVNRYVFIVPTAKPNRRKRCSPPSGHQRPVNPDPTDLYKPFREKHEVPNHPPPRFEPLEGWQPNPEIAKREFQALRERLK